MKYIHIHHKGFSIIEVMVGIFIFTMGLISIYVLLVSSLKVSDYNKNAIIAGNLAREQIELLRNIRDTNYTKLNRWNQINPNDAYASSLAFGSGSTASGSYYIIENDFSLSSTFTTKLEDITSTFIEGQDKLTDAGMKQYQVCEDLINNNYVDCPTTLTANYKETYFYKYLQVQEALYDDGITIIPETFQITSKVIWFKRGYHEFDIKTLISDWRRI